MWFLSQSAPGGTDWLSYLGAGIPFGVLAVGIILDQRATIKELRNNLSDINQKLVAVTERTTAVLTDAASALSENTHALTESRRRER